MIPQELRIGNWINYKGEPIPVTMIGLYGIQSNTEERVINASFGTPDLTPIPLTPEILEACGFVKFRTNKEMTLEVSRDSESGDGIMLTCYDRTSGEIRIFIEISQRDDDYKPNFCNIITDIKSVHRLQNLYYSLTGKEIEYKPVTEKA